MVLDSTNIAAAAERLAGQDPRDVLVFAFREFAPDVVLSFSGAEDVAIVDMAVALGGVFRVVSLDTGRLHPETYQFLEQVRSHYGIPVEVYFPQPAAVESLVAAKGLFSFYQDGHTECCGIRKVEPLARALHPARAWITGQRKDQSPNTRAAVPVVQLDPTFGAPDRPLVKFNPLSHWTSAQVWAYIRERGVPFNPLHARGFVSIGCEPCTRPVNPSQHEREGRWWWEEETKKECGLHIGNVP